VAFRVLHPLSISLLVITSSVVVLKQSMHRLLACSLERYHKAIRALRAFYPSSLAVTDLAIVLENDGKISESRSAAAIERVHYSTQVIVQAPSVEVVGPKYRKVQSHRAEIPSPPSHCSYRCVAQSDKQ
jgi:hypothetical protein